jgi:PIN domain nuclease of toxin-antitoxin system
VRLLLDSHVALWWLADLPDLGPEASALIAAADDVRVSVVTPWELGIKRVLGKLDFPDDMLDQFAASGFTMLPISASHAFVAPTLPMHHRDPFDRMLIAQAMAEQLTIVTADQQFDLYDIPTVAADA